MGFKGLFIKTDKSRQTKKLNSELSRPFYGRGVICCFIYNNVLYNRAVDSLIFSQIYAKSVKKMNF